MESYTITTDKKLPFWVGDRFYKVECKMEKFKCKAQKTFSSVCPACHDERTVSFLGYDGISRKVDCPVCHGKSGYGNTIDLYDWEVREYIVHSVTACGEKKITAYKDKPALPYITMKAFHKIGRCMSEYVTTDVPTYEYDRLNPENLRLDSRQSEYVFRDKKDAERYQERLVEYDKARLIEFNQIYKTDYEYPF